MAKDIKQSKVNKQLPPLKVGKKEGELDATKFHSYQRDPVTGELVGVGKATKPRKKESK